MSIWVWVLGGAALIAFLNRKTIFSSLQGTGSTVSMKGLKDVKKETVLTIAGLATGTALLLIWWMSGWNPWLASLVTGIGVLIYSTVRFFKTGEATWQQGLIAGLFLLALAAVFGSPTGRNYIVEPVKVVLGFTPSKTKAPQAIPQRPSYASGYIGNFRAGQTIKFRLKANEAIEFGLASRTCPGSPNWKQLGVTKDSKTKRRRIPPVSYEREIVLKFFHQGQDMWGTPCVII